MREETTHALFFFSVLVGLYIEVLCMGAYSVDMGIFFWVIDLSCVKDDDLRLHYPSAVNDLAFYHSLNCVYLGCVLFSIICLEVFIT